MIQSTMHYQKILPIHSLNENGITQKQLTVHIIALGDAWMIGKSDICSQRTDISFTVHVATADKGFTCSIKKPLSIGNLTHLSPI